MSETVKAVVTAKVKGDKAIKVEGYDNFFSTTFLTAEVAKINKGDLVEFTYTKKGIFFNVKTITKLGEAPSSVTKGPEPTQEGPSCSVCGKVLKNPAYSKCWGCKDKEPKVAATTSKVVDDSAPKAAFVPSKYGSPEDIMGKEVGCAAGCAAQILSGAGLGGDTEAVLETFRVLFDGILTHMRATKGE